MARLFWFRRDLRLQDHLGLNAAINGAIADGDAKVAGAYFLNISEYHSLTAIRQWSLFESLRSLNASMDASLNVFSAERSLEETVVNAAKSIGAETVHATRAFDPAGIADQNRVGIALKASGIFLELTDSHYAISPGSITKADGSPYRVYTPFYNAWMKSGWQKPVKLSTGANWQKLAGSISIPEPNAKAGFKVVAGEEFALRTLMRFEKRALNSYNELRDRADLSGTSHLSHALTFGEIHPRTILDRLGEADGPNVFRKEIAWREFYADVLWHNPHTIDEYYDSRFAKMEYNTPNDEQFALWCQGKTGFPMVDAGMRQLLADGWMHNRVRMIVASFLVKDLHIEWQHGARWFEKNLSDFDPASNSHGWQWTAGSGTDASPYYRIFNPITQGLKFDPNGDYVRKYIPELRHIAGAEVHQPWLLIDGLSQGYSSPIVDHATERIEALARLEKIKKS
ncbi:MAG: cryptochrome/photolyase family protein [Rhodoluna sp.]